MMQWFKTCSVDGLGFEALRARELLREPRLWALRAVLQRKGQELHMALLWLMSCAP